MMEQLAAQRKRFMQTSTMATEAGPSSKSSGAEPKVKEEAKPGEKRPSGDAGQKEFTCCHCLAAGPASEDRPIGLVTWVQSTSVLAQRHHKTEHLSLPVREDEEGHLKAALEESLGNELKARFHEMVRIFDHGSVLMSLNRSWNGGIHIQSCGHHMHYDCRQSYCETLRQQTLQNRYVFALITKIDSNSKLVSFRISHHHALDTDSGEFICPMCRQAANALLPVAPDPPNFPANVFPSDKFTRMHETAVKIKSILIDKTIHLVSTIEVGV